MSPEEELYDLACQDMPVTGDEVREALDKFKRAYAHELAELQRLRMDELDLTGQKARIVGRIVALIDQEVPGG